MTLIFDIVLVFVTALIGGFIAERLRQSPIIGYILGGIFVGPYVFGLVNDINLIREMADIGVILLMFTLGMEFSLSRLDRVKGVAVLGGLIQIVLVTGLGMLASYWLGFTPFESAFLGCALSISSTMIVLRTLGDQGELNSTHSQIMIGILIVQDLSVIVMVSLLPSLHNFSSASIVPILVSVGKTVFFVFAMLYLARKVVPAFLDRAAKSSNNEVFLLLALSMGLGVAALANLIGLSVSLGAFVAGLVISESEYTHEIMGKIVSFRDAFVVLFFVAVGMMVNPSGLLVDWLDSLVVLAVIIVGKFLVVFLIVKAFGFHNRIAFYSGMGLLQTGEFSIVLAGIGLGGSLISTSLYNIILATAIISIMLTPMFIEAAPRVYAFMASKRRIRDRAGEPPTEEIAALRDHVILCGYGRVGHHIGDALLRTSIPFVVIDYDYLVTKELSSKGIPFIYGDSANDIVLSQANPQNASMAILTLPDVFSNRNAVRNLQKLNSSLTILARAHTNLEKALLYKLGVDVVVQPETEAGMKMIWHMMFKLNLSAEKIDSYLAFMLEKDYHRLFSAHSDGQETIETLQLEEFMLLDDSSWVNKSLRESSIRQSTGCYVVSIRKANGKTKPNPHSHEVLEEGDMVIVMGTASQLLHFANYVGEEKDG